MVFYAFVIGGLVTFFALVFQFGVREYLLFFLSPNNPFEILVFSGIEEILKFAAVWWFIVPKKSFNEPLDAMVYMVIVALGFAAVENITSLGNSTNGLVSGVASLAAFEVLSLRFVGATLLHSLASAIVGYHWGHAMVHKTRSVKKGVVIGLVIAILLHGAFNYLILLTGPLTWVLSFILFVGFFVMADFERLHDEEDGAQKALEF